MTRIGNVDHVLMLLKQQLKKLDSTGKKARSKQAGPVEQVQSHSSLKRLSAVSSREGISEQEFEKALVRALLVDELGGSLAEDHRFDKVASEVHRLISIDPELRQLLKAAADQAQASG